MLPRFDLVRIVELISLNNLGVLVGIAVELLADLRQRIARTDRVSLRPLTNLDVALQIRKIRINCLDRVPDAILAGLSHSGRFQEELVAIEVEILELSSFSLDLCRGPVATSVSVARIDLP